jgi:pilus assembly protein Flp/PilA
VAQVQIGRGNNRQWDQAQTAKDQEHYMKIINRFVNDESGATAIEYGLIAAGISVAIVAVVNSLGTKLVSTFSTISSQLATAGK